MKYLIIAGLVTLIVCLMGIGWATTYNWENAPKEEAKVIEPKSNLSVDNTHLFIDTQFTSTFSNLTINSNGDIHFMLDGKSVSLQGELNKHRRKENVLLIGLIFNSILIFILWMRRN